MKIVNIEFLNIQSHEHTRFQLQPGLNFILADDNNVGKSTIFKVLLCCMQYPTVSSTELDELIRGGCSQARATFRFDNICSNFWIFRNTGKATHAFFETDLGDGVMVRTDFAPPELREAFDMVMSDDHKVVNFNDADSVQLIVEDTPKNDEILSKILIDLRVNTIKSNLANLGREIIQDYHVVQAKLDDATHVLSTMHYTHAVDDFNSEKKLLTVACRLADIICEPCEQLENTQFSINSQEVYRIRKAFTIYEGLSDSILSHDPIIEVLSHDFFEYMRCCLRVNEKLLVAASEDFVAPTDITQAKLDNAQKAINVLESLLRVCGALTVIVNSSRDIDRLDKERKCIIEKLNELATRVQCPIKGEVFYSDDKCIPYRD